MVAFADERVGELFRQRARLAEISEAKFGDHIVLRPWLAAQAYDLIPNSNRYKHIWSSSAGMERRMAFDDGAA